MTHAANAFFRAAAMAAMMAMPTIEPASAITAELAKKCRELTVKAHPPAVAGSRTGTAQVEREFFRTCVDQGGNVKDDARKEEPKK
jgi:hypothetical protein